MLPHLDKYRMKAAVATSKDGGVARRGGAKDGGGGAKEWEAGTSMYKTNDPYADVFNHKFTFRHAVSCVSLRLFSLSL